MSLSEATKRHLLRERKPHVYKKMLQVGPNLKQGIATPIIQFQYDYRCNFECEHCCTELMLEAQIKNKKLRHFEMKDIRKLASQADALGLPTFVITGGEPLCFKNLDKIVEAIDPQKFWIVIDTNGWLLDSKMAKNLVSMGVDKVQISLDGADPSTHDEFRNKPGSWAKAIAATMHCQDEGLQVIWQTVVWKDRPYTKEFIDFLELGRVMDVPIYIGYVKPIGEYEGRYDQLVTPKDEAKIEELRKDYNIFTHFTPSYDMDIGCIAVKRMISVTRFGEVWPCPFIHLSIGNVFDEPLATIIDRGMKIKWFGKDMKGPCWIGTDRDFLRKYIEPTYGKEIPVKWKEE